MKRIQAIGLVVLVVLAAACEPKVQRRGHVDVSSIQEKISAGITSKDTVRSEFGSPSSMASYGGDIWYYVYSRKEANAFFAPEVTEQTVIAVVFDENETVKEVLDYGLDDSQPIVIVSKTTPTEGHSLSFMEQVLGNVGRFNQSRETSVNPRGPPGR